MIFVLLIPGSSSAKESESVLNKYTRTSNSNVVGPTNAKEQSEFLSEYPESSLENYILSLRLFS